MTKSQKSDTTEDTKKRHNKDTRGQNSSKKRVDVDFDELALDWVEEIAYFVAFNNYKVYKEELAEDLYEYRVRNGSELIISIVSSRNLNKSAFSLRRRRRRRR